MIKINKRDISLLSVILFLSVLVILSFKAYDNDLKIKNSSSVFIDNVTVEENLGNNKLELYGDVKINADYDSLDCILLDIKNNKELKINDDVVKNKNHYTYKCYIDLNSLKNSESYMFCFKIEKDNKVTIMKTNYIVYSDGKIIKD